MRWPVAAVLWNENTTCTSAVQIVYGSGGGTSRRPVCYAHSKLGLLDTTPLGTQAQSACTREQSSAYTFLCRRSNWRWQGPQTVASRNHYFKDMWFAEQWYQPEMPTWILRKPMTNNESRMGTGSAWDRDRKQGVVSPLTDIGKNLWRSCCVERQSEPAT